jgi:hypothetical protein
VTNSSPVPRFQFSVRWLLISVAVVAGLLALASLNVGQVILGLLFTVVLCGLLPTVAVASAVYARGDLRTFAIGAVVASIPLLTSDLGQMGFPALVVGTISQLIAMALCGAAAVVTRRWLDRHGFTREK